MQWEGESNKLIGLALAGSDYGLYKWRLILFWPN